MSINRREENVCEERTAKVRQHRHRQIAAIPEKRMTSLGLSFGSFDFYFHNYSMKIKKREKELSMRQNVKSLLASKARGENSGILSPEKR